MTYAYLSLENLRFVSVNVVDGEVLHIMKVSRLHMAVYLCIASNGVPPSISKRVSLRVQCQLLDQLRVFYYLINFCSSADALDS